MNTESRDNPEKASASLVSPFDVPLPTFYFEDFEVGARYTTMGRTVTDADVRTFVGFSGIYEEVFINNSPIEATMLKSGGVAPGAMVFVLAEGLFALSGLIHQGLAFISLSDAKWRHPVFVGDTIRCAVTVERLAPSPGGSVGLVESTHVVSKVGQEEPVLTYRTERLLRRAGKPDNQA